MAIRIINNLKVELTDDEYTMYQQLCRSYDRPNCKGEEMFVDLFATDNNGIITFIRPPSVRYTSLECFCFVCAIFHQQHMRLLQRKVDRVCDEMKAKVNEALAELKKKD